MKLKILKCRGNNCPGCKIMDNVIKEFLDKHPDYDYEITNDLYEDQKQADKLKIRSLPTTIVYRGDEEIGRKSGAMMPTEFKDWIHSLTN